MNNELTYCMNVHPGETLADVMDALQTHIPRLRKRLKREDQPFGLGLRLSDQAAQALTRGPAPLRGFKTYLADNNLYVWTINAFPYGAFHNRTVKETVYSPDWSERLRVDYTKRTIDILQELLPQRKQGSISTLPLGYKPLDIKQAAKAIDNLTECAAYIRRDIILALEPEPDCALETIDEVLAFFQPLSSIRRLGICFDTCHHYVQFEDPAESLRRLLRANIPIGKVQLSAALSTRNPADIQPFIDPVWLHQTRTRADNGTITRYPDLTPAILPKLQGEIRTHFHIPLYAAPLPAELGALIRGTRLPVEIETYTFSAVPPHLRSDDIVESIAREYEAAQQLLNPAR